MLNISCTEDGVQTGICQCRRIMSLVWYSQLWSDIFSGNATLLFVNRVQSSAVNGPHLSKECTVFAASCNKAASRALPRQTQSCSQFLITDSYSRQSP